MGVWRPSLEECAVDGRLDELEGRAALRKNNNNNNNNNNNSQSYTYLHDNKDPEKCIKTWVTLV